MSSISSSSTYSVGGTTNYNGISGLMSGMDTTAMVNSMLAFSQAKIDAAEGEYAQAEMRQTLYRGIIQTINDFTSSFFDTSYGASSTNNLASSSFFNSMFSSVTSTASAASIVSTSSSAYVGDVALTVSQLASYTSITGQTNLSGQTSITGSSVTDSLQDNFYDLKEVTINAGGSDITVNLNGASTESQIADRFTAALKESGSDITASVVDGKLTFSGEIEIDKDNSTASGLSTAGLNNIKEDDDGKFVGTTSINIDQGYQIDLTVDGVTKSIYLADVGTIKEDGTYTVTQEDLENALQSQVKTVFGDYVTADINDNGEVTFSLNFDEGESGHSLRVTMVDSWKLGITPGSTTDFSLSSTLSDIAGGDSFEFEINGVSFEFDGDTTLNTMMTTINKSNAGVTMTYSSLSDTMKITSSDTGEKYQIEMSQSSGAILSALFGEEVISGSDTIASDVLTTGNVAGGVFADFDTVVDGMDIKSTSLTMNVNGTEYTFEIPEKEDGTAYTSTELVDTLNGLLETEFGVNEATGLANVSYDATTGELVVPAGMEVSFEINADYNSGLTTEEMQDLVGQDLGVLLGFTGNQGASNMVDENTNLADISAFNGMSFVDQNGDAIVGDLTLGDIMDGNVYIVGKDSNDDTVNVQLEYDNESGQVSVTAPSVTIEGATSLFGKDPITLGNGQMSATNSDWYTAGTDAKFTFNGVETSRSTNTFTVEGITLKLTEVSALKEDGSYEETIISTSRDVDSIVDGITSFVEAYNSMISEINELLNEDASYKDYAPLTDAQKAEMTETEITNWEAKTSEGLLRNDSTLTSFLSALRTAMYSTPSGSSLAIYSIGIDTTSDYNDGGKLEIDEAKLREMIEADPDGVAELFTGENGLSSTISGICSAYANTSSGSQGLLVQTAGYEGTSSDTNNTISNNLSSMQSTIDSLKMRFEQEEARYWAQFTAMETAMSTYNTVYSMLMSEFASY